MALPSPSTSQLPCSSVHLLICARAPIQQLSRDFSINLSDQRKLGKSPKTKLSENDKSNKREENIYFANPDCTTVSSWDLLLSQFLTISKGIYNSQKTFCVYGSSNWIKMFGLVQALQNLNSKYAQSTPHDTAPPWNFEWDKRNASLFNISDKLCDNCHRSHYKFSSISQMFFLRSTPCENNKTK